MVPGRRLPVVAAAFGHGRAPGPTRRPLRPAPDRTGRFPTGLSQTVSLTLADVEAAAERIRGYVHLTPCLHSRTFSELCGAGVWLKYENLQRTGSYKLRGALNRILTLPADARHRGVIAASAGNH